ncbi:MAG: TROVE domain-containing protein, partial [Verrucomicrobiota bacterium]
TNFAGGEAYQQSPRLELVSMLLTCTLQDQYYRSADQSVQRLRELIPAVKDPRFVAKAAIYARKEAGMRSATHLVAAELAQLVKGEAWSRHFYNRVVHRVDDVLEILAYTLHVHGKPIPNSLKKGLGDALTRFDEYQLAKYRKNRAELKLVDAVNLLHPRSTPALDRLVDGTLRPAETWETKLTKSGQGDGSSDDKEEQKAQVWTDLIRSQKIGYFALLRNLRNILEQSPDMMEDALQILTDPRRIQKSLVLPFRFRTALDAVLAAPLDQKQQVVEGLNVAVDHSLANVPVFEGKTLVVLDGSASMMGRPMTIGSLFAAVLYKAADADFMLFSNNAAYHSYNQADSTLTIAQQMERNCQAAGTNFHAIFETARRAYRRIIILSDMQGWMGYYAPDTSFDAYVSRVKHRPLIYSFDLTGYGTLQFPAQGVYALAGFSDKTLETMSFLESDQTALLKQIESIDL